MSGEKQKNICDTAIFHSLFIVKMTCGRVNRLKTPVEETPIRSDGQTRVLYPDAKVRSGWVTTSSDPDCHSDKFSGGAGCHATGGGCH